MSDQPIEPGQILAGKYAVDRVLGTGAMGLVLAATHLALGTRVAIKVQLGGSKKKGPEHDARFLREARVAAMLRSQHAAKVLDLGTTEGGAPYIVMEFLEGKDLASYLEARGPLPIAEAVGYVLQACEAIAEAHALGIVHRDIKPANLFLTKGVDGAACVKVVDFGIAKHGEDTAALTQTGAMLGSPLFMSPEHATASRHVDGRADIWSLGVTLYQLLANTTPFHGDTAVAVLSRILTGLATPLSHHRPDLPGGLEAVISQCFERDRDRRWPTVAALAAALAPYGPPQPASYAERVASVQKVEIPPSRPTTELQRPSDEALAQAASSSPPMPPPAVAAEPSRPKSLAWVVFAVAMIALAAGVPIALYFGLRTSAAQSTATSAHVEGPPVVTASASASDTAASAGAGTTAPAPETAAPALASAAPPASSPAAPRNTAAPARQPHPTGKPRTSDNLLGGSRR